MIAGAVEKSEDGGATWKLKYPATGARIIAGSAPSVKICWLVGENGTILRTTNGAHWKTINPPAQTDFMRVEATDALTATVTALDGRDFDERRREELEQREITLCDACEFVLVYPARKTCDAVQRGKNKFR